MNDKRQLSVPMIQAGVIALFLAVIVVLAVRGLVQGSGDDVATSAADTTTTTSIPAADRSASGPDATDSTEAAPADEADETSDEPTFAERLESITVVVPETSSTTTVVADTTPVPEPIRIPRPTCADGLEATVTQTAPFTGLQASIPSGLPAVVVKVSNNSGASRAALLGLDSADIVYEERIEAPPASPPSSTRSFPTTWARSAPVAPRTSSSFETWGPPCSATRAATGAWPPRSTKPASTAGSCPS